MPATEWVCFASAAHDILAFFTGRLAIPELALEAPALRATLAVRVLRAVTF
ncbi:MAG TPA: hypothetical protein VMF57_21215 [Solirubrobacteraceae bacterium]|nr:hypothetical protein [Solirubrobacteraceae bacterium]